MSLWQSHRTWIRLAIYLAALVMVWLLWRQRRALQPSWGLSVARVEEVDRLGSLVAMEGERLLAVDVRVSLAEDFSQPLGPDLFRLIDDRGQEHAPDPGSPLFLLQRLSRRDRSAQGTLVFHLPVDLSGRSLVLHPEGLQQRSVVQPEALDPSEEK